MFASAVSSGPKLALAAAAIALGGLFAVIVPTGTSAPSAGGVVGTLTADWNGEKTVRVCLDGDGLFGYLPPSVYEEDSFRSRLFSIIFGRGLHPLSDTDQLSSTVRTIRTKAVIPTDLLTAEESASLYRRFWDGEIHHNWHKTQPEGDFDQRMEALETATTTPSIPEEPVLLSDNHPVKTQPPAPSPEEILEGNQWDEHAAIPTIDLDESVPVATDLSSAESEVGDELASSQKLAEEATLSDDPLKNAAEEARKSSLLSDRSNVERAISFIPAPQPVFDKNDKEGEKVSSSQPSSSASPVAHTLPPNSSVQGNGLRSADLVATESYLRANHVVPVRDLTSQGGRGEASVANLPPAPSRSSAPLSGEDDGKVVAAVQARPLPHEDALLDEPRTGQVLRPAQTQGVVSLTPGASLAPPAPVNSYRVQPGETLESIADRFQLRDGGRDTFFIINGSNRSPSERLAAGTIVFVPETGAPRSR